MTLFDEAEAEARKNRGMEIAAANRRDALRLAQWAARQVAREEGEVTSDDVARRMDSLGHEYESLQNAAGSVFRGDFEWTGRVVKSIRASTHGRMIRVWRLKEGR